MEKPKIFISHCQDNFKPTDYAIRIIDALGCTPVIAENQPKLSRPISNLVISTFDKCDIILVIATADLTDKKNGKAPSRGVLQEVGMIKKSKKHKGKYFIVKESGVNLGAMSSETYYEFSKNNLGTIAEAILIELGSMGAFKNYFELKGSEYKFHEFIESIHSLKEMNIKGHIHSIFFEQAVTELITKAVNKIVGK
jgi:Predicted nucleotide-binding protein containing TIR-like domain